MAIFTIAGLTLKEAWRRRTLLGAALLGALVVGFSLLLILMRARFVYLMSTRHWSAEHFASEYLNARLLITLMSLFFVRILGLLFPILLTGGAISGEIEQGLLSVILARPVPRWQILLGKWLGLNTISIGSVLVWTAALWLSLRLQTGEPLKEILLAGPYLALYSVLACTLTLTLSTVCHRVLGTSIAVVVAIISWLDGILNFLGEHFNVPAMHPLADAAGLLMPQGYVAWWIRRTIEDTTPNPFGEASLASSQFMQQLGQAHLHFAHLDAVYVALYIFATLSVGFLLFHRREVS
jgi:ABC-type transport system involved in multi-copper enzyme maturation permease subunit